MHAQSNLCAVSINVILGQQRELRLPMPVFGAQSPLRLQDNN